ncbi:hypothetical protein L227DRAFT_581494 [Lentinus tigrinus ALCF2SS1-6]|uniref:Uncharacterized protein n=1 Tax=Lentinus tigrinus ALCF2SS1-6 TaxID=1328759 RepID=A0A5C2RNV5_9APHY|nr:hypothetical protein L227DRAFT_581494 [Lentinus tigrinus ALCF2SS1-6]
MPLGLPVRLPQNFSGIHPTPCLLFLLIDLLIDTFVLDASCVWISLSLRMYAAGVFVACTTVTMPVSMNPPPRPVLQFISFGLHLSLLREPL